MNDQELDRILETWNAPDAPPGMRDRLAAAIPARPQPRILGLRPRWILAFMALAGALALGQSLVTETTFGSDAGAWDQHTFWRRTRYVHPAIAWLRWRTAAFGNNGVKRDEHGSLSGFKFLIDPSTKARCGYQWTAQPLPDGRFQVTFQPLDSPKPAEVHTVGPGSTFDVDLYHEGHERVYDHYEFFAAPVEVAPLQLPDLLTFAAPHLYIDGKLVAGPGGVAKVSGQVLTVSVAHRGHYSIGLAPQGLPGYQAAGRARGNVVEFEISGEKFRVECSEPMAPGADKTVYVRFKPDPGVRQSEFFAGVAQ